MESSDLLMLELGSGSGLVASTFARSSLFGSKKRNFIATDLPEVMYSGNIRNSLLTSAQGLSIVGVQLGSLKGNLTKRVQQHQHSRQKAFLGKCGTLRCHLF